MRQQHWKDLGFFSLSSVLVLAFYGWGINYLPFSKTKETVSLAQAASKIAQKGREISLNGRKFPVAWIQWRDGNSLRTGISDTGAMETLGLTLLNTNNPEVQPVEWFSANSSQPTLLQAKLISPYRYLELTELLQSAGAEINTFGETLTITFSQPQIQSIRPGNQTWGKRLVIDLDRPAFWRVSQAKSEGVVMIESGANATVISRFQPQSSLTNTPRIDRDEDDPGSASITAQPNSQGFFLEQMGTTTKIRINLPTAHGLQVFSLANPNRIVVDIRPDFKVQREIVWTPGVIWRQQNVRLNNNLFPVTWLEINLGSPEITLKPITSAPNTTTPLMKMAPSSQAIAAINGGFFNRNTKLPLGAIRRDSRWLSGPILNRGAIAWNEQGKVKIGRLSLRETAIASTGNRLPILFLNSGYLQAGMARYTREWGPSYTTLTDDETIILVKNQRVFDQRRAGKAGNDSFAIPVNGYLLTIRKNAVSASDLAVGTQVTLDSTTVPAEFANYSQILGAGPLLLQNRQIVLNAIGEKFSKAFAQQQASRSAVATTNQGTLIIAAVHNRVGGRGATLTELAQIIQSLGAIDALNLDGGSSTSLYLGGQLIDRSPVTAARVHNGIGIFVNR